MKRKQLEKLYEVNGLADYRLRNTEDLLRVHGIDFTEVSGYSSLDDLNKSIFEKFIVNIFNSWGLDSRLILFPKSINLVLDIEYYVKENPDDDYFILAGHTIYAIDRNENKRLLYRWEDEAYKHLKTILTKPIEYLRFEYQLGTDEEGNPRDEWLHVISEGREWF